MDPYTLQDGINQLGDVTTSFHAFSSIQLFPNRPNQNHLSSSYDVDGVGACLSLNKICE